MIYITLYLLAPLLKKGYDTTFHLLDRGIIEMVGPHGMTTLCYTIANSVKQLQTGFVYH